MDAPRRLSAPRRVRGRRHTGSATIPGYGLFQATTVTGSYNPAECAKDARIFARDARAFLAHSGADAAYPADLYYVILRGDFADFQARLCEIRFLGRALERVLTPRQRAALVAGLPRQIARVVHSGLTHAGRGRQRT